MPYLPCQLNVLQTVRLSSGQSHRDVVHGDLSWRRNWCVCAALLLMAVVAGCGDGRSSVSGKLTLDGKPLARSKDKQVTIMFFPESGNGAPAAALADESGKYELTTGGQSGLAPGNYVVTLVATEFTSAANDGASAKRIVTPLRYANPKLSGLRAEVQPGRNTFDYDLTADSGA
jgi:hypothetical protein